MYDPALRLLQSITTILQAEFGSAASAINWSIQYDGLQAPPWNLLFVGHGADDLIIRGITASEIKDKLLRSNALDLLDENLPAYSAWWAKDRDAEWAGFVCTQRMRGTP